MDYLLGADVEGWSGSERETWARAWGWGLSPAFVCVRQCESTTTCRVPVRACVESSPAFLCTHGASQRRRVDLVHVCACARRCCARRRINNNALRVVRAHRRVDNATSRVCAHIVESRLVVVVRVCVQARCKGG